MKSISLWQPWASLIALGAKQVETRSWQTNYRGPVAIHAAQRLGPDQRSLCSISPFRECLEVGGFVRADELPRGMFVAIAELVEIVPTEVIGGTLSEREAAFGDYAPGRFAWKLEKVQPIHVWAGRGQQGLWELNEATAMLLRARVKDL
ncbi:MAG: ASCH domain-containing protein [Anaerolineae bacterium]|nr:ASCH domain-containing protein [Anaerolineae bacterium]